MTTPSSESSDYNPRKRMRKGTHSCLECRRRKIRCIYEDDATTCNRCITKRLDCADQEYGDAKALGADKRKSMRERTNELEGMITQILTKLDNNAATTGPQDQTDVETKAAEALRCLRTELLPSTTSGADVLAQGTTGLASPSSEKSDTVNDGSRHFHNPPLLSLFDNSVLATGNEQYDASTREPGNTSRAPVVEKNRKVLSALKSLMPSQRDLGLILRGSRQNLQVWKEALRGCSYKLVDKFNLDEFQMTLDFIQSSLQSEDLAIVAQTFACLALTMQQLPGTFDFSTLNLPASVDALQDHYITAVETLLAADDSLSSTIEGLSCLIIQTKYYVNMGKPRKGWLTIRRALNFAQMLSFHRQSFDRDDEATTTRRSIWLSIYQVERFLSLLLGYPSACLDQHFEGLLAGDKSDPTGNRQRFNVKISVITGQIINRNQNPKNMTVAATHKIDEELEEARSMLPAEWWNPPSGSSLSSPESDSFDKFISKTFFHNIRILLHLPFMLKSSSDRRYEYSRIAALESSRNMIHNYHCIRHPDRPLIAVCNVIDFQVFTAAMLITINLLGNPSTSSSSPSSSSDLSTAEQNAQDWSLIHGLISDLREVVKTGRTRGTSGVAAQALTVLEDLSKAKDHTECKEESSYQAVIPYFGKIRLRWGSAIRARRCSNSSSASASVTTNTHTDTTPNSSINQMPTPTPSTSSSSTSTISTPNMDPHGIAINPNTFTANDPKISFDSFFQPLPGDNNNNGGGGGGAGGGVEMQPWLDSVDWNAMNEFELLNDWNWFAGAQGMGGDGNGLQVGGNVGGEGGGTWGVGGYA
ncbi:MAG: hypothetical protein Q9169_002356 [Polycauliona sp. 2 TL-2023]